MQVAYLSEAWLAAVDGELAARHRLAGTPATAGAPIGITQLVHDGDAHVVYHVAVRDGVVTAGWGPADPEDVRIVGDRATATAIASGARNAAEAFIRGEVRVTGDPGRLVGARDLLSALDDVMAAVAARTRFGDA